MIYWVICFDEIQENYVDCALSSSHRVAVCHSWITPIRAHLTGYPHHSHQMQPCYRMGSSSSIILCSWKSGWFHTGSKHCLRPESFLTINCKKSVSTFCAIYYKGALAAVSVSLLVRPHFLCFAGLLTESCGRWGPLSVSTDYHMQSDCKQSAAWVPGLRWHRFKVLQGPNRCFRQTSSFLIRDVTFFETSSQFLLQPPHPSAHWYVS